MLSCPNSSPAFRSIGLLGTVILLGSGVALLPVAVSARTASSRRGGTLSSSATSRFSSFKCKIIYGPGCANGFDDQSEGCLFTTYGAERKTQCVEPPSEEKLGREFSKRFKAVAERDEELDKQVCRCYKDKHTADDDGVGMEYLFQFAPTALGKGSTECGDQGSQMRCWEIYMQKKSQQMHTEPRGDGETIVTPRLSPSPEDHHYRTANFKVPTIDEVQSCEGKGCDSFNIPATVDERGKAVIMEALRAALKNSNEQKEAAGWKELRALMHSYGVFVKPEDIEQPVGKWKHTCVLDNSEVIEGPEAEVFCGPLRIQED